MHNKKKINIVAFLFLIALAQPAWSDACLNRLEKASAPSLPSSQRLSAVLGLNDKCSIALGFNLDENGNVVINDASASPEGCDVFIRSARAALENSQYSKGEFLEGCKRFYSFRLREPDEKK